jgi:hypothetical protein
MSGTDQEDELVPNVWRVGSSPLSGVPHLRFTSRKETGSTTSWTIGVIMDQSGAIIVSSPHKRAARERMIGACVAAALAALREDGYEGPVELSVRAKDFDPAQIAPVPGITLTPLEGEEMSPLVPGGADEVFTALLNRDGEEVRDGRLRTWHRRACQSPQMIFRPINDQICVRHQVRITPPGPLRRLPLTSVVGLAGVGKSSLISALLGLAGEDLPPSSMSRTTLCPIAFRNTPETPSYWVRVRLRPEREIVLRIADRLTAGLEAALAAQRGPAEAFLPGSTEAEALMRSPDSLFDLRFILGRYAETDPGWSGLIGQARDLLTLCLESRVSGEELFEFGLTEPVARESWGRIRSRIAGLPFGELSETDTDGLVFDYSTGSRKAAIEAGRRFYAVGMRYAGQSFGPLCERVTLSGPWVPAPAFEIVDNRGFDHEGALDRVAGDDLVEEIAAADRVLVVESAEKVGDRQTMGLVSRIIANGEGGKVLFACTRADIPLRRGADLDTHVGRGLLNGLNALNDAVGPNAVQAVRDNLRKTPPFVFGGLDVAYEYGEGGLLVAPVDEETDQDNAAEAGRLLRALCADPNVAEGDRDPSLNVSGARMRAALTRAWTDAGGTCLRTYGPDRTTRGSLHWGAIKAEVRRVTRNALDPECEVLIGDMLLLSAHAHEVSAGVSRVIDASAPDGAGEPDAVLRAANALRRNLRPLLEQAVIRRIILAHLDTWTAARDLSLLTFGRGSTLERAELIRQILQRSGAVRPREELERVVTSGLIASGASLRRSET